jgi:hypothetical protein
LHRLEEQIRVVEGTVDTPLEQFATQMIQVASCSA